MAETTTQRMTPTDFEAFVQLPHNINRLYELIAGEVVDVVAGEDSSGITAMITTFLGMYLLQNPIGFITGSQGGYRVGDSRLIPDVGFVLFSRRSQRQTGPYADGLDLAVEVVSPTDRDRHIAAKVHEYTTAGTRVWLIEPDTRTVQLFTVGEPVQTLHDDDTLLGGDLLPGFSVPVAHIFDALKSEN